VLRPYKYLYHASIIFDNGPRQWPHLGPKLLQDGPKVALGRPKRADSQSHSQTAKQVYWPAPTPPLGYAHKGHLPHIRNLLRGCGRSRPLTRKRKQTAHQVKPGLHGEKYQSNWSCKCGVCGSSTLQWVAKVLKQL